VEEVPYNMCLCAVRSTGLSTDLGLCQDVGLDAGIFTPTGNPAPNDWVCVDNPFVASPTLSDVALPAFPATIP
jgi:hypothetical protein